MPHGALYTAPARVGALFQTIRPWPSRGGQRAWREQLFLRSAALAFSVLQSAETRFDVIVTDLD